MFGVRSFVEDGFGSDNVLLRGGQVSPPRRDASLRMLPAKIPQIHAGGLDVRFFQSGVVAKLVPSRGSIQVAGVDAYAGRFVRDFSLLEEVFRDGVVVENLLLVFGGLLAVRFKGIRHGYGSVRRSLMLGRIGNVDGFLEILAGFVAPSQQIEDVAGSNVGGKRIRRGLERLAIMRESLFQLSFAHQLLALLDELWLLALGGSLRKQRGWSKGEGDQR